MNEPAALASLGARPPRNELEASHAVFAHEKIRAAVPSDLGVADPVHPGSAVGCQHPGAVVEDVHTDFDVVVAMGHADDIGQIVGFLRTRQVAAGEVAEKGGGSRCGTRAEPAYGHSGRTKQMPWSSGGWCEKPSSFDQFLDKSVPRNL